MFIFFLIPSLFLLADCQGMEIHQVNAICGGCCSRPTYCHLLHISCSIDHCLYPIRCTFEPWSYVPTRKLALVIKMWYFQSTSDLSCLCIVLALHIKTSWSLFQLSRPDLSKSIQRTQDADPAYCVLCNWMLFFCPRNWLVLEEHIGLMFKIFVKTGERGIRGEVRMEHWKETQQKSSDYTQSGSLKQYEHIGGRLSRQEIDEEKKMGDSALVMPAATKPIPHCVAKSEQGNIDHLRHVEMWRVALNPNLNRSNSMATWAFKCISWEDH